MASRTSRAERASVPVEESSPEVSRPDPEVPERARRRYFSAQYKLRVLEEADACQAPGEVGALLRREGLYSSQLTAWRRARREGSLQALSKPRGPQGRRRDPVASENERAQGKRPSASASGAGPGDSRDPKKSLRDPGHPPEPARQRRRRMSAAVEQLAATVGVAPACRALSGSIGCGRWG